MKNNEEMLSSRVELLNKKEGARVGDFLKLPYGMYTRFTHAWDESIQTGGHNGFYLGNYGSCSYSGGLDSGVKYSDIRLTTETRKGSVWFFKNDNAAAHNDITFEIDFRVFELVEGADTSGLPQIKKYEHEQFLKSLPTITRINGNGQPYTLPLPVIMLKDVKRAELALEMAQAAGIATKEEWSHNYSFQPTTHEQMTNLLLSHNFKTTFYNNGSLHNTLMLELNY